MENLIQSKVDYGNAVDNLCKVHRSFGIPDETADEDKFERDKYEW